MKVYGSWMSTRQKNSSMLCKKGDIKEVGLEVVLLLPLPLPRFSLALGPAPSAPALFASYLPHSSWCDCVRYLIVALLFMTVLSCCAASASRRAVTSFPFNAPPPALDPPPPGPTASCPLTPMPENLHSAAAYCLPVHQPLIAPPILICLRLLPPVGLLLSRRCPESESAEEDIYLWGCQISKSDR